MTALLGGTFNPPHNGHVALAHAAEGRFGEALIVLVAARPAHKEVALDAETRVRLARAAFPNRQVELDPYERTVDLLKGDRWRDPLFLLGADEFCDFLTWKDPEGVVARARLAVATRPGYPRDGVRRWPTHNACSSSCPGPSAWSSSRSNRCRSPHASCGSAWRAASRSTPSFRPLWPS